MTEILYDKDENGWEKGAVYEFSVDGKEWSMLRLTGYDKESPCNSYRTGPIGWLFIRKCQAPLGKIHKKPVGLIDGEWYKFDIKNPHTDLCVGMFYGENNIFSTGFGVLFAVKDCTNITRMVEAKDNENS